MDVDHRRGLPAGDREGQGLRPVVLEHQLGDLVGHRHEQLVALLHGQVAGRHLGVEQDLDVDLVVRAVDAGRVVDGVGVDQDAVERGLDPAPLGQAEVAALDDHRGSAARLPSTRMASLARSPTSALVSVDAFTYVPMPPFQSRSTGALRMARQQLVRA